MIAQSLEGYADMLRATGRVSEADWADLMARSIRAQNPRCGRSEIVARAAHDDALPPLGSAGRIACPVLMLD